MKLILLVLLLCGCVEVPYYRTDNYNNCWAYLKHKAVQVDQVLCYKSL